MLKTLLIFTALIGTAELAQPPEESRTTKRGVGNRAHELVCISELAIGSTLNRRRICRTRAEWAEHRLMYKQAIERAQLGH